MITIVLLIFWLLIAISHYLLLEREHKQGVIAFIPVYGDIVFYKVLVPQARWWFIIVYVLSKPFAIYLAIKSVIDITIGAIKSLANFFSFMLNSLTRNYAPLVSNNMHYLKNSIILILLCIAVCIFVLIAQSQFAKRIAKRYGKGSMFKLGLIFVPDLLICFLAFTGAKPKARKVTS